MDMKINMELRKEFDCPRRDGTKAKFVFVKPDGSVWYWDVVDGKSLPLPDVNLNKAENLKECLDLISEKRGKDWVGQVVVDLLKPIN